MVMAMFGGAMIPAMFMPSFLQRMSSLSPVRWAIHALEGSIWREFTWAELFPALAILLAIGATGMIVGSTLLSRRQD
jgi:ABC-2 type transport system permease protein